MFDIFRKPTKKELARERINNNRIKGKEFEDRQDFYHCDRDLIQKFRIFEH